MRSASFAAILGWPRACSGARIMTPRPRSSLTLLFAIPCLVACTSDDAAVASGDADYRSKPTGADALAGSVLLVAPPAAPGTALAPVTLTVGANDGVAFGTPVTKLLPERVRVAVAVQTHVWSTMRADVLVRAGQTTSVAFGGLVLAIGEGPETLGLGTTVFAESRLTANAAYAAAPTVQLGGDVYADGKETAPVLPGEYAFAITPIDGAVVAVAAGSVATADLRSPASRRMANVRFEAGGLPNGCGESLVYLRHQGPGASNGAIAPKLVPVTVRTQDAKAVVVGVNDAIVTRANAGIEPRPELVLPCVTRPLPIPLGNVGAGPREMKVGRLDVDDVDVTGDFGASTVRGTYEVFAAASGEAVLARSLSTGTGVDLPAGTYRLVVRYRKTGGEVGSFEETFSTP